MSNGMPDINTTVDNASVTPQGSTVSSDSDVPKQTVQPGLLRWRNAIVLARHESDPDQSGKYDRITLLTSGTLPYPVRIVETIHRPNPNGPEKTLTVAEMAASHVLAAVPEGGNRDTVLREALEQGYLARPHTTDPDLLYVSMRSLEIDGVPTALADLAKFDSPIDFAEPDYLVRNLVTPDDPSFMNESLWGLHNTGSDSGAMDVDIDGPEAWDLIHDASDVIVAVVDTGVRYTHEDLAANMWVNPGEIAGDGIDNDNNGVVDDFHGFNAIETAVNPGDPMDKGGHGTHCAGTIGAVGNNGIGISGVAWQVQIMACKFLGENGGFISDGIKCIDYAVQQGAQVISASYGGSAGNFIQSERDAIDRARRAGVIMAAAAGNATEDTDRNPNYPSAYNLDNIISVASHTRNDRLSDFSNFGETTVDIAAPGDNILSTYHETDDSYNTLSGTSMATPHISGMLALLRSRFPQAGHQEIINRLLTSGVRRNAYSGRVKTGARANLLNALQKEEVVPLPEITRTLSVNLPHSGPFAIGESLTLSIDVTGEGPFSFEWARNGQKVSAARASSLALPSLTENNEGEYVVTVSNRGGSVSSRVQIFVRVPVIGIGNALESPDLEWFSPTAVKWLPQSKRSYDGMDAASSQGLDDDQNSSLETAVNGPGFLSFWWRVSTEAGFDFLKLYVNNQATHSITGQPAWQRVEIALDRDQTYQLRWSYEKDSSDFLDAGENSAWLDEVNFVSEQQFAPRIDIQPSDITVEAGASATFSVIASGSDPLSYQWEKDGTAIPGATNNSFVLNNVGPGDEGRYRLTVQNDAGSVHSRSITLQVRLVAPRIVSQPTPIVVNSGETLSLSVQAVGTSPITFEWTRSGEIIPEQNSNQIIINPASINDAGSYQVTATNAAGSALSDIVTVQVNEVTLSPEIVKHPISTMITAGEVARLSIEASGREPLSYQWQKGSAPLAGANDPLLLFANITPAEAGDYSVVVSNPFGSVTSNAAAIIVRQSGNQFGAALDNLELEWTTTGEVVWFSQNQITSDNEDALQSGNVNDYETSTIQTIVTGPGILQFNWRVSSEAFFDSLVLYLGDEYVDDISGETDWETYELPIPIGSQTVTWSYEKDDSETEGADAGWLDQVSFLSTFDSPPTIIRQPAGQAVAIGGLTRFEVEAISGRALSWQWYRNNSPIPGATAAVLVISDVQESDLGEYSVEASNSIGATRSSPATLVVFTQDNVIGLALDFETASWGNDSLSPWSLDPVENHDGFDSISANIFEPGTSTSFGTRLTGPAVVSFWWRVESNTFLDFFQFLIDGRLISEITGEGIFSDGWTQVQVSIPDGDHTLTWLLETEWWEPDHDAWVDQFQVLEEAEDFNTPLNTEALSWISLGNASWFTDVDPRAIGNSAARSGMIADDEFSVLQLQTEVIETTAISFNWRVSSEAGYDTLSFYIDGELQDRISGDSADLVAEFPNVVSPYQLSLSVISPGRHFLEWVYEKDADITEGEDAGWVDDFFMTSVNVNESSEIALALEAENIPWLQFHSLLSAMWETDEATAFEGATSASTKGNSRGRSIIETTIEGGRALGFAWKTDFESEADSLRFQFNNFQTVAAATGQTDWNENLFVVPEGEQTIRWAFDRQTVLGREATSSLDAIHIGSVSDSVNEILNSQAMNWRAKGDGGWLAIGDEGNGGNRFLVTSPLLDAQFARLETIVTGPGRIQFDWAASTEEDYDFFEFLIDGIQQESISGEVDWTTAEVHVPEGSHTLAWVYSKDGEENDGDDSVGLDSVEFESDGEAIQLNIERVDTGVTMSWTDAENQYQLEASPFKDEPAEWQPVSGIQEEGDIRKITVPISQIQMFFRLAM